MTGKDSGSLKFGKPSKAVSAVLLHPESLRFWAVLMLESCPGLIWFALFWASLVALMVKNLPAMQETYIWMSEDPLEKRMATHSVFLPGLSHGQRSLAGYHPWGCKESDTTDFHFQSLDSVAWSLALEMTKLVEKPLAPPSIALLRIWHQHVILIWRILTGSFPHSPIVSLNLYIKKKNGESRKLNISRSKTEDWNVMFHMQSEKMNIFKVICY